MEIYLADVCPLADESLFEEGMALLPEERRERIARLAMPADRQRSLGAGLLLEYGLRKRGISLLTDVLGFKTVQLECGLYGKPCIRGRTSPCFNLSHSGDYAVAVIAERAVGVDIERLRPMRPAVARRCFSMEELAYLSESAGGDASFTWLWTRKESYVKAVGEGMHLPLADFSVLEEKLGEYRLHTFPADAPEMPKGYVLSVCAKEPVAAVIEPVEPEKLFDGTPGNRYNEKL